MKSIMNVFNPKRPAIYALLLAIVATVTLFAPSCSKEEGAALLIDDENNPPVSMTFHRIAEGNYITGYTEADNVNVTMQMNTQTAENIYDWLTHFTVGEEISEAKDYSPFRFTVEYKNGEEVSFGFYDCEIDGKRYAIEFTDGAVGTEGEQEWREIMTNTLKGYTDFSGELSVKYNETQAVYYATAAEYYEADAYTTDLYDECVLLPLCGPSPGGIPSLLAEKLDINAMYPRFTLGDSTAFIQHEPMLVINGLNDPDGSKVYQMALLPRLTEENGRITATVNKDAFTAVSEEVKSLGEKKLAEKALIPSIDDPDYDWSEHIFPQPAGTEIVKIELSRDAYGAMATGIDEIDHVRVDVTEFQSTDEYERRMLSEAAANLRTVKYGEEIHADTVASINYSYAITATYADGSVIKCEFPLVTKDGKKYRIDGLGNIEDIMHSSNGRASLLTRKQFSILSEMDITSNGIEFISSLLSEEGTTQTLLSKDSAMKMTLPPLESDRTYEVGCAVFSLQIEAPSELDYTESLVIESADKSRSVTCYAGADGVIRCEDNGKVTWHRSYLLSDSHSTSAYTDILISNFNGSYSQLYLMSQ